MTTQRAEWTTGQAAAFTSPVTRMLLAGDGSTTALLEALTGLVLDVDVRSVRSVPGSGVHRTTRELLDDPGGASAPAVFLVRRTALITPAGQRVSENTVVARRGADPRVDELIHSRRGPIGFALAQAGFTTARRILHVGTATWTSVPDRPRCASKTYRLDASAVPLMCIRERFNPRFVPADTDRPTDPHPWNGQLTPAGEDPAVT